MEIRLYSPFSEEVGESRVQISVKGTITTKELVSLLFKHFPGFEKYRSSDTQDPFYHLLLLRDDAVLRLEDSVNDADSISITLPLAGG
ncbi:hypothetical protein E3J48_06645 [Candidatus Aerophobetes bacterium]|uniref:MoaD/ThiS family protein n=1 Tax=Aerophobetes bacterium TaxID=2030807 RepID=A0A523W0E5_UNCAE|nr:MAG: hypothetical protein E3J48_06645 [Candidatus Aerophobetes bacterium]